jgi:hypothetical protein
LSVSFLVAHHTKNYQILGLIIAQTAARLNVMDFETFDRAARLATPTVSLQHLTAQLPVGFRHQPKAWPFGSYSGQRTT